MVRDLWLYGVWRCKYLLVWALALGTGGGGNRNVLPVSDYHVQEKQKEESEEDGPADDLSCLS